MKFANIRELKLDTNTLLEQAETYGPVVVTRNGKPVAMIRSITEDDLTLQVKSLWPGLKKSAQKAGYTKKSVTKLIKQTRGK